MAKQKVNTTPLWRFLFLVYCAVMLWLLFGRSNGWNATADYKELLQQNANLIPLRTVKSYVHVLKNSADRYMLAHCFLNLAGNILLFIPAGWLLPRLWSAMRNFFRFFGFCAGVILFVEVLQLFSLLGRFDVDDLILNLLGLTVGFLLYTIANRK